MEEIEFSGEYIKLGQALKLSGIVGSGTDAKFLITEGLVSVDDVVETRRGRKLFGGEKVSYEGNSFIVVK